MKNSDCENEVNLYENFDQDSFEPSENEILEVSQLIDNFIDVIDSEILD
jgi:hypothetical protein